MPESSQPELGFAMELLRILVTLAILIPLLVWATRWYGRRPWGRANRRGLRVLVAASVGPQKTVQLVEVGDRILVIGVSQDGIRLLSEIREPDAISSLKTSLEQPGAEEGASGSFSAILREWVEKRRGSLYHPVESDKDS